MLSCNLRTVPRTANSEAAITTPCCNRHSVTKETGLALRMCVYTGYCKSELLLRRNPNNWPWLLANYFLGSGIDFVVCVTLNNRWKIRWSKSSLPARNKMNNAHNWVSQVLSFECHFVCFVLYYTHWLISKTRSFSSTKTSTNRGLLASIFPPFAPVSSNYLDL